MFKGFGSSPPRKVTVSLAVLIIGASILSLLNFDYGYMYSHMHDASPSQPPVPPSPIVPSGSWQSTCGNDTHAAARKIWLEAEARYANLTDEKFTIVMPSYKRPDVLNTTLSVLLKEKIPSLHEVVIVWNDYTSTPPADYISHLGIPVRHHVPNSNSLNNRFAPNPSYSTQAIFHSDDDLWFEPSDLEFAFQVWRQTGRYKVTGALPRCYSRGSDGRLAYTQCGQGSDWYSMIITNLAFVHISFMDFYSLPQTDQSVYAVPTLMRQYVDDNFNCEDIAMNFLVSMLTCSGPLHVMGNKHYTHQDPTGGISKKGGHWAARQKCMNAFEEIMGFFPLVKQMGSIQRGVPNF